MNHIEWPDGSASTLIPGGGWMDRHAVRHVSETGGYIALPAEGDLPPDLEAYLKTMQTLVIQQNDIEPPFGPYPCIDLGEADYRVQPYDYDIIPRQNPISLADLQRKLGP